MKQMNRTKSPQGFTLVELSISIAFIATLSILVVLIISNAVSAYHRGLTLNQLNTVGMDLVDDMRAAVQTAPGVSLVGECEKVYFNGDALNACREDGGASFVRLERYANVSIGRSTDTFNVPVFGAFCTGAYSYVWNSGYFFNDDEFNINVNPATLKYKLEVGGTPTISEKDNFRLLKIKDSNRAVCKVAAGSARGNYSTNESVRDNLSPDAFNIACDGADIDQNKLPEDICDVAEEGAIDVLSAADNSSLALYDLTTAIPAESSSSNNMFYAVSFILGTIQGGINVSTIGNYCATPEDYNNTGTENFDYCAINKFNFAAQATGEKL